MYTSLKIVNSLETRIINSYNCSFPSFLLFHFSIFFLLSALFPQDRNTLEYCDNNLKIERHLTDFRGKSHLAIYFLHHIPLQYAIVQRKVQSHFLMLQKLHHSFVLAVGKVFKLAIDFGAVI